MAKQEKIVFNGVIISLIKEANLPVNASLTLLMSIHYDVIPEIEMSKGLMSKVYNLGIVSKDYATGTYKWKYGLFENIEVGFEWLGEWMDSFKAINKERRGSKAMVTTRMKKLFVENPSIRKDDVIKATERYFSTLSAPQYCMKSHKFIMESGQNSMLLEFIGIVAEETEVKQKFKRVI